MRWQSGRRSRNIEDRRGVRAGGLQVGGIGLLVVLLLGWFMGANPMELLMLMQQNAPSSAPSAGRPATPESLADDPVADFVSVVLADTEDTWNPLFRQLGRPYEAPTLVLFSDAVQSACGYASTAVGPFYCPADRQVYIDLSFFRELDERFGAPGDFAQAYVIAHEVGHHVQTLLGISEQVNQRRSQMDEAQANALSVRQELQADCFAGVWGHHADRQRRLLEPGDVEEGLTAAAAIGDDRIQQRSRGYVVPESFTHGTSEQRMEWLQRGLSQGTVEGCDTFGR